MELKLYSQLYKANPNYFSTSLVYSHPQINNKTKNVHSRKLGRLLTWRFLLSQKYYY